MSTTRPKIAHSYHDSEDLGWVETTMSPKAEKIENPREKSQATTPANSDTTRAEVGHTPRRMI
jgi:hypothetical protein